MSNVLLLLVFTECQKVVNAYRFLEYFTFALVWSGLGFVDPNPIVPHVTILPSLCWTYFLHHHWISLDGAVVDNMSTVGHLLWSAYFSPSILIVQQWQQFHVRAIGITLYVSVVTTHHHFWMWWWLSPPLLKNKFVPRLRPRLHWGSLQHSPDSYRWCAPPQESHPTLGPADLELRPAALHLPSPCHHHF